MARHDEAPAARRQRNRAALRFGLLNGPFRGNPCLLSRKEAYWTGRVAFELLSTGFIAGFTIVVGIVALAIVEARLSGTSHGVGRLGGALFGIGTIFLVVGRVELFSENYFEPVATVVARGKPRMLGSLGRLWSITFLL